MKPDRVPRHCASLDATWSQTRMFDRKSLAAALLATGLVGATAAVAQTPRSVEVADATMVPMINVNGRRARRPRRLRRGRPEDRRHRGGARTDAPTATAVAVDFDDDSRIRPRGSRRAARQPEARRRSKLVLSVWTPPPSRPCPSTTTDGSDRTTGGASRGAVRRRHAIASGRESRLDGRDGIAGLGRSGPPACAMSGRPPPPLPPIASLA